jgi:hypothetical protein
MKECSALDHSMQFVRAKVSVIHAEVNPDQYNVI